MSRDFDGNVIVVTGGSSGLGRAIAVEVAKRGAKTLVVNYSRNAAEAEETADLVRTQGAEPILVQADVSEDAGCRSIARRAEPYGRINALFNNAGVTKFAQDHADMDAVSTEDFLRLYHVNVVGAYQMIRAARSLLAAEDMPGAVVNTSSLAGIRGLGSSVPYAASKGALNTMTLSLARALAPEIRVNAVCPGYVATRWFSDRFGQATTDKISQDQIDQTPLKRAGMPDDIADS